jgi:hypothetical protein
MNQFSPDSYSRPATLSYPAVALGGEGAAPSINDDPARLRGIFRGLELVHARLGLKIVYPIHPRTRSRCREHGIDPPEGTWVVEPLDYFSFLKLESEASLILTDSGGGDPSEGSASSKGRLLGFAQR